jgi:hypothetical protein
MKILPKVCLIGLVMPLCGFAAVPSLYIAGYGGYASGESLLGTSDLLIPIYLANENAFIVYGQGRLDPMSEYSWEKATWSGSGGLLYRQIVADTTVIGTYVLSDYNQATSGHQFWSIGPGIESLGRNWDLHLNGYIPVGDKTWKKEAWAHEYGDYTYTGFQEGTNNVYDHRLAYYEEVGFGGDAEVGLKLFKIHNVLVKGYVQGYYYNLEYNDDIYGGGAKITVQPTRYLTFSLNDTYDNYQHNVLMAGVQVRVTDLFDRNAGKPIDENNLTNRLLDPIDRNFATIGSGTSAPVHRGDQTYDEGSSLFTSNGVFFEDSGTGYISPNAVSYAKGTYGNPYTEEGDLYNDPNGMQGIFNTVRGQFTGQVYMFFAPGTYYTPTVQLPDGMNIWGRDYWYTNPTSGDSRALFLGKMQLRGNNNLDSIRIENVPAPSPLGNSSGVFDAGILIDNADNVSFNNVQVGTLEAANSYATGVSIANDSAVTINNSQIYGYSNYLDGSSNISAVGINSTNGNNLIIGINNTIEGMAVFEGGNLSTINMQAIGIESVDSNLTIGNRNVISSEANVVNTLYGTGTVAASLFTFGIYSVVNVSGVTNTVNIGNDNSISVKTNGFSIDDNTPNADVNSEGIVAGLAYFSVAGGNTFVSIGSNNNIEALATGDTIFGTVGGTGTEAISTTAIGIIAGSGVSTLNINGNNNKIYAEATSGVFSHEVVASALSVSAFAGGYITGEAFVMGPAESTLNINGRHNEFKTNDTEGIFVLDTPPVSLLLDVASFGMYSAPDTDGININLGNYNSIIDTINDSSTSNTGTDSFTVIGIADAGINNNVVIGNYNTIEVKSYTATPATDNAAKNVFGIYNIVGNNITMGSYNKIFVESSPDLADNNFFAGVFNGGVFTFQGGHNEFNISGGDKGTAAGIVNQDGKVHFNTGADSGYNIFNVSMSGTSASSQVFGILIIDNGEFFKDNIGLLNVTDLYNFLNNDYHTTFNHTGGDPSISYLINWIGNGTCTWSNPSICS